MLEVISTFETDLRYLRVAMGASASLAVIATFVRSFHVPPSHISMVLSLAVVKYRPSGLSRCGNWQRRAYNRRNASG